MDKKYLSVIALVLVVILMYIGTTMFYNTGLAITDLNVEKSGADNNQYEVTYLLRSVRGFDTVEYECTLLSDNGQTIGQNSSQETNLKDGTFNINQTVTTNNNSSQEAAKIKITLYEIESGKSDKKTIYDQTFDI